MVYKNKEDRLKYAKNHYKENKSKYMDRVSKNKRKIRVWFNRYKDGLSCELCGENNSICLIFHHKNPKTKLYNIATMVGHGYSKKTILSEIEKCMVLCLNCHRKVHKKTFKC